MFNKPALFPKVADSQSTRGARVGSAGIATAPVSSQMRGPSDLAGTHDSQVMAADESVAVAVTTESTGFVPGADATRESGSRLIVGPDVKLKGAEILDCDTLVVEGRVEATMDSRVIRIAENGSFAGTVGIDVAEVHGRFEGELTARSQLVIHATGRVSGKIRYGKILIEAGGEISGDVQSLATAKDVASSPVRAVLRDEPPIKVALGG